MIKRSLIAVAVAVAVSSAAISPAQAFYCPKTVKAIDAAVDKSNLGAAKKSEVRALRNKGLAQHKDGDHKGAVKSLAEAVRIILNNM
jgi:hypothetical protein